MKHIYTIILFVWLNVGKYLDKPQEGVDISSEHTLRVCGHCLTVSNKSFVLLLLLVVVFLLLSSSLS